jgi:hypothetical protein
MSSYNTEYKNTEYKGNYYNMDFCKFLGLVTSKKYYKSYIIECFKSKLELSYGRYKLNTQAIEILNNNNVYIGWNQSVSQSIINRMVSQLKVNVPDTSMFLVLKVHEEGTLIEQLVI